MHENIVRQVAAVGNTLEMFDAEAVILFHLPLEQLVRLLALQCVVNEIEEFFRVFMLLHLQQQVADGEAGDLVGQLSAVKQQPQQPGILEPGGNLRGVIQQGDIQFFVFTDVSEGCDAAGANRLQREFRARFRFELPLEPGYVQIRAALTGKNSHVAIRAAGQNFRQLGIDPEVARIEAVLARESKNLFRGQTLRPVQGQHALPMVALAVQHFEALEHDREFFEQGEIDPVVAGIKIQRMRQNHRNILLVGVPEELVDVVTLAIENLLLFRRETVGQHVHEQAVLGEVTGELGTD